MSTTPSSREPARATPLNVDPTGQDPDANDPMVNEKLQLQLAIFEVTPAAQGKSLDEIQSMLRSAFAARGVESPPGTWLDSVASSVFYGEPYIIDLPAAVAADNTMPAPSEDVRRRLSSRRRLRQERLPAGIFPSPSDWDTPDDQATNATDTHHSRRSRPRIWSPGPGPETVLAAVLIGVAVLIARAARAARRRHTDGQPAQGTSRKGF